MAKIYKDAFAEYLDYRGIEERLNKLETNYAALEKKPTDTLHSPKPRRDQRTPRSWIQIRLPERYVNILEEKTISKASPAHINHRKVAEVM